MQVILFLLAAKHHCLGFRLGAGQIDGELTAQCLRFLSPLANPVDRGCLHFTLEIQQRRLDVQTASRLTLDIGQFDMIDRADDFGGLAEIPTREILGDAADDTEILDVWVGLGNIDHRTSVRTDQLGGIDVTRRPENGAA